MIALSWWVGELKLMHAGWALVSPPMPSKDRPLGGRTFQNAADDDFLFPRDQPVL